MNTPSDSFNRDRNLLFGILALQMSFVTRDALIAGMNEWAISQDVPIGEILMRQGSMTADQRRAIDLLLLQHLMLHDNDPEVSIKALGGLPSSMQLTQDFLGPGIHFPSGSHPPNEETETSPPPPPSTPGIRYRILKHHADGGQGRVYVANDAELNRQVALKENKLPHAGEDERLRLVLEAEITGGLEHPGIVPVYGLGTYEDGRPYYAMRFIRGDSFDAAIRNYYQAVATRGHDVASRLVFRGLLRRFVDVCNAIAYAHSRGVVHRDIKPRNVMLGEFGETLVVDWGLAKVGSTPAAPRDQAAPADRPPPLRPSSGSSMEATMDGAKIGTAPYMSPEQAAGRVAELGPSTDIYSLGASLYVLLTGRIPVEGSTRDETLEKVREGRIPAPRSINPHAPAALEAICRKAMSLSPHDRYPTAQDLATDVEHWLADEAVSAYDEPWSTTLARWSRRHRAAVGGIAIFLVCLALGAVILAARVSIENQKTVAAKAVAEHNLAIARQHMAQIIRLIESSEPELAQVPHLHARRAELLRTASDACREYVQQQPDDLTVKRLAAKVYRYRANFERLLNHHEEATRFYAEALAFREAMHDESGDRDAKLQLADHLRDYASSEIAQGHFPAAEAMLRRALELVQSLEAQNAADQTVQDRELALLYNNLGNIERLRAENDEQRATALATVEKSSQLLRAILEEKKAPSFAYDPLLLGSALNQHAILSRELGRVPDAVAKHAEAATLVKTLRDTNDPRINRADVEHFLAELQLEQCRTWSLRNEEESRQSAETNAGVTINRTLALTRQYPTLPNYVETLAKAQLERAQIRLEAENYTGAREHLRHAVTLLEPLAKAYPHLPSIHAELGKAYLGLAIVARQLGDEPSARWLELAEPPIQAARKHSPDDRRWRKIEKDLAEAKSQ